MPTGAEGPKGVIFEEKLDVPRASDVLAQQLRRRILAGELRPGQLLPPERALVEQAGVGRVSVREALRMLESEQLIQPKHGRYGGWLVTQPGPGPITRSIDVFIRGRQIQLESLLETREALEPPCARLAARNRTEDDLARLKARGEEVRDAGDVSEYLSANLRWHLAVVEAANSDLMLAFMTALSTAIHASTNIADFNSEEVRAAAIRAHDAVESAIADRDEDAAFRRMYRHVSAFRLQATSGATDGAER